MAEQHERSMRRFEIRDRIIEVQTDHGTVPVAVPNDWGIHDLTPVRRIVEALGGTVVAPQTDALLAFAEQRAS